MSRFSQITVAAWLSIGGRSVREVKNTSRNINKNMYDTLYLLQNSSESLPQYRTLGSVRVQEDNRYIHTVHQQILLQINGH